MIDRNWDQEDEAEEQGIFSVAREEVLKKSHKINKQTKTKQRMLDLSLKVKVLLNVSKFSLVLTIFGNGGEVKPLQRLACGNSNN